jgi:hypothetical protein
LVTREKFDAVAKSFAGVTTHPHFDRAAYKIRRIFVTLAGDGRSANVKLTRDEQEMRCALHPEALSPVPNKFGGQGWTTIDLVAADIDLVRSLLGSAAVAAARK